jgi:hypothetical protein
LQLSPKISSVRGRLSIDTELWADSAAQLNSMLASPKIGRQ